MRYTLFAAFHLNMHAAGGHVNAALLPDAVVLSLKRKRTVDRISLGYTRANRRRFTFSRLDEALGGLTIEQIVEQIYILETHDIVTLPFHFAPIIPDFRQLEKTRKKLEVLRINHLPIELVNYIHIINPQANYTTFIYSHSYFRRFL